MEHLHLQSKPTTLSKLMNEDGNLASTRTQTAPFHSPAQPKTPLKLFQVTRGRIHSMQEDTVFSENRGELVQILEMSSKRNLITSPHTAVGSLAPPPSQSQIHRRRSLSKS